MIARESDPNEHRGGLQLEMRSIFTPVTEERGEALPYRRSAINEKSREGKVNCVDAKLAVDCQAVLLIKVAEAAKFVVLEILKSYKSLLVLVKDVNKIVNSDRDGQID